MGKRCDSLEAKALELPAEDRARLAERLISSLDREADADAEALWCEEAERRLEELEAGRISAVGPESVIEKSRSTLR